MQFIECIVINQLMNNLFCLTSDFTFQRARNNLQLEINKQTTQVCKLFVTQFGLIYFLSTFKIKALNQQVVDTERRMKKELDNKTQEHGKQIAALQQANMVSLQKSKQDKDRLQEEKSDLQRQLYAVVSNFLTIQTFF